MLNPFVRLGFVSQSDSLIDIRYSSAFLTRDIAVGVGNFISRDMRVRDAMLTSGTFQVHEKLVNEGKVRGQIDAKYIDQIKNGVAYWDGRERKKDPVLVNLGLAGDK